MSLVVVPVDFLEGAVLVTEVTTLSIWAKLFSVELTAVLAFILVVSTLLLLSNVKLMSL